MDEEETQHSHLLSICAALGGYEEKEVLGKDGQTVLEKQYVMGDEALACLRDLKRLLRKEDALSKERNIVRALGRWKILQTDLIPILMNAHAANQDKIAQAVVQLFIPLTWPVDSTSADAAELLEIQRGYKEVFLKEGVLAAILEELLKPLSVNHRDRSDRDNGLIGLILTLFRNLLAIKDVQAAVTSTTEKYMQSTLQEHLIQCMEKADIIQLLLSFAGSMDQREYAEWNLILMEVFYYFFLERDPEAILAESKTASIELARLLEEEERRKRREARKPASRHSRFGGTLSFKLSDGQTFTVHNPASALNSVEEALDKDKSENRGQRKGMPQDEYQKQRGIRSAEAARIYERTAKDFLENCFNGLMSCVKRDFDMERDKVQDDHYARFFWLCSFFLKFQLCALRQSRKSVQDIGTTPTEGTLDFDTVTGFLNMRGLQFVFKRMRMSQDEKRWTELYLAMDCLKHMLLVLDAMSASTNEEYREASENMQSNMYYEHASIEQVVSLVKNFKRPLHLSYLKTLVEVVHILLKMLEAYAKNKGIMFTRKKKGGNSKKAPAVQDSTEPDVTQDYDSGEEESVAPQKSDYVERQFKFEDIESAFASESVVSTYCALLKHYREIDERSIDHITRMFHRIFVKSKAEAFFYKLSTLELFNRILTDIRMLPSTKSHKELYGFIKYMLAKFFKKAAKNPVLLVEVLFPKTKADCQRIENGGKLQTSEQLPSADKDLPVKEIEVKPGLTWSQEVQVAVALLLEKEETHLLEWVKESLLEAATMRVGRPPADGGPELLSSEVSAESYDMKGSVPEKKEALKRNTRLRLLLRLLKLEEVEELYDTWWRIPSSIPTADLFANREMIVNFMQVGMEGSKPASEMVRKRRNKRKSSGSRRRQAKEQEPKIYKSAAYIEDSDDTEGDEEFFRAEAERRVKMAKLHGAAVATALANQKPSRAAPAKAATTQDDQNSSSLSDGSDAEVDDSSSDESDDSRESDDNIERPSADTDSEVDHGREEANEALRRFGQDLANLFEDDFMTDRRHPSSTQTKRPTDSFLAKPLATATGVQSTERMNDSDEEMGFSTKPKRRRVLEDSD
ncbi:uncharacterized protein SPPG_02019 [Spizellomyces punctatus DAOM BR117]|uniref:Timeless N-terminal domain-containing protein n=1 Tax=Spizellomyces punctatus (strain DAOM BR117) TaxID=645134 RepID=A0A0L0HPP6_SPIPD|nr:uncharacterized protein SPPG_02019 [Spizellomyces punctatus DAOM BR117]KND02940.1 hypothetical protein SPPG_02019 [Spizellomyces punctatus DAOM BR117]|eukprot:XP_016610979.1 hypothetical protein SPPG_02019 [Spizellomyces punctatus DAOM BR117]